ncbi:hypothetical protein QYE76_023960 [Lolium multiflorum]|uniref:Reverse transcriptase domain-containing protein n=1 Tax=Lolium multiflorum TaxID=4521 RepID=A0AAD8RB85_LOLMU|nr:hypothetical protein QYE76_023960 [Lolium multiflorum]
MLSEINRLREANFIKELHTEALWVANPVMVPKKNTEVLRMCVDFTCLNEHCPKDHFPLPRIDQIIDSTAGCERLSFLDAYSGYNQIRLKEEDEVKTAFITPYGVFCYRIMPFGLKNAGATYQRMMQKCLAMQIGKNVQVYIDDVIITNVVENMMGQERRLHSHARNSRPRLPLSSVLIDHFEARRASGHLIKVTGPYCGHEEREVKEKLDITCLPKKGCRWWRRRTMGRGKRKGKYWHGHRRGAGSGSHFATVTWLTWTSCGSHDDLDKWRRVHCGAPTAAPLASTNQRSTKRESFRLSSLRVSDKGLGKTEKTKELGKTEYN